jgi:hypothetical protein
MRVVRLLLVVLGLGALAVTTRGLREHERRAAAPQPAATTQPSSSGGPLDPATIDALASRVAARLETRGNAAAATAERREQPTAEQRAAVDSARRTLDDAIARGHLRTEDVVAMRGQLAMSGDGAASQEIALAIAVAVHRRKLVPDDPRMLMP